MRRHRRVSGQSTAEYAVVIAVVVGAVIGMQAFNKRGLQARYKAAMDTLTQVPGTGDFTDFAPIKQYEPYYAEQNLTTERNDQFSETYAAGTGTVGRTGVISSVTRKAGGTQSEKDAGSLDADNSWK